MADHLRSNCVPCVVEIASEKAAHERSRLIKRFRRKAFTRERIEIGGTIAQWKFGLDVKRAFTLY